MKAMVTVPHAGTRFLADTARRCGIATAHAASATADTELVWHHFYEGGLPRPDASVTTLRSPIAVLGAHDRDQRPLPGLKRVLSTCYRRQLEYLAAGCVPVRVESETVLADLAAALGTDVEIRHGTERHPSVRDYRLKERLAERDIALDHWKTPELVDWWLAEMGWVDVAYAELGYDTWWRALPG